MPTPPALLRLVGPLRLVGTLCLVGAVACFGVLLGFDLRSHVQGLVLSLLIATAGGWGLAKALRIAITGNVRIVVTPLLPAAESRDDWQVRLMGGVFALAAAAVLVLGLGLSASAVVTLVQDGPGSRPSAPTAAQRGR